jgi:molecular chaperone GrpE (heat shock protein)
MCQIIPYRKPLPFPKPKTNFYMLGFFNDLKRSWRLVRLLRASDLSDEDALRIEKMDSLYIEKCREIARSLKKARRSVNLSLKSQRKENDSRLTNLENTFSSDILGVRQSLESRQKASDSRLSKVVETSETTMNLVENVREYVGKQADEVRRWQDGYDWRILKNYLMRIISTMDDIERKISSYKKQENSQELIEDFDFFREALEIHLEEEGLLAFSPSIGYPVESNKADVKGTVPTTSEDQIDETVAEIIHKGYEIDLGIESKVIRRAQVKVYKKEEK